MLGFQPRLIVIGGCIVAIRDSQKRAVAKYNAANYDRVELRLEKGQKDVVKAHAEAQCESLNAFIVSRKPRVRRVAVCQKTTQIPSFVI